MTGKRTEEGRERQEERAVRTYSCLRGSADREGLRGGRDDKSRLNCDRQYDEGIATEREMEEGQEKERRDQVLHSYRGLHSFPSSALRSDGYRVSPRLHHGFSSGKREEISLSSLSMDSSSSSSVSSSSSSSFSPSSNSARQRLGGLSHSRERSYLNEDTEDEVEEEEMASEGIRQSHVAFVFLSSDGCLYVSGDVPGILVSSSKKRETFMKYERSSKTQRDASLIEELGTHRRDLSSAEKREVVKNQLPSESDLEKEDDNNDKDDMMRVFPSSSGCIYRGYPIETCCCLTGDCLSFSSILAVNSASLALSSGILLPRHRRHLKKRREERNSSSAGGSAERRRQAEGRSISSLQEQHSSSLVSPRSSAKLSLSESFHTWLKASYLVKRLNSSKEASADDEGAGIHDGERKKDDQDKEERRENSQQEHDHEEEEEEGEIDVWGVYTPRSPTTDTARTCHACAPSSDMNRGEDNAKVSLERRRERGCLSLPPFCSSLSSSSSSSVAPDEDSSFSAECHRDRLSLRVTDRQEEEEDSLYCCSSLLEDKDFTERGVLAILQTTTGDLVFMTIKDDVVTSRDRRKEEEEREGGSSGDKEDRKEGEEGEQERQRQAERLPLCLIPEIARRRMFSGEEEEEAKRKRRRRSSSRRRERRVVLGFKCLSRFDLFANFLKQKEEKEETNKRRMMTETRIEGERRERKEDEEDGGANDSVSDDDDEGNTLGKKLYEGTSSSSASSASVFSRLCLSSSRRKREGGVVAREEETSSLNFERRAWELRKFLERERWIAGCLYTEMVLLKPGDVFLQEETSSSSSSGQSILSRFLLLSTLDDEQHRWLAHFFHTHLHLVDRIQNLRLGFERLTFQQSYSQLLLQRRRREEEEEGEQGEDMKKEATMNKKKKKNIKKNKKKKNSSSVLFKKDSGRRDCASMDKIREKKTKGERNVAARPRRRTRRERERSSTNDDSHTSRDRRDSMKKEEEVEDEKREGKNRYAASVSDRTEGKKEEEEEEGDDGLWQPSDEEEKKKRGGYTHSAFIRLYGTDIKIAKRKRRRRRCTIEHERRRLCWRRERVADKRRKRQDGEETADERCCLPSSSAALPRQFLSLSSSPQVPTSDSQQEEEEEEERFLFRRGRGLLDWEEDDGELRLFFNTWKGRRRATTTTLSQVEEEEEEEEELFFVLNLHRKCVEMVWESCGKFHFLRHNVLLATSTPQPESNSLLP